MRRTAQLNLSFYVPLFVCGYFFDVVVCSSSLDIECQTLGDFKSFSQKQITVLIWCSFFSLILFIYVIRRTF